MSLCSTIKPLLLGAAFLLPALSFAQMQYPDHAQSTQTGGIVVSVKFLPDFDYVDAICSFLAGIPPSGSILGCFDPASRTIYAVEPTSFNDEYRLMILGHEFWHALGADHP